MKPKSTILQPKGFSLTELMVVVAIIGVLAAIGSSQYSKFQSKARQIEAKSALSALYVSELGFYSEWNLYSVDLVNIGFGVAGSNMRYATGFHTKFFNFTPSSCTGYALAAANSGAPPEFGGSVDPTLDYMFRWSCAPRANQSRKAMFNFFSPGALVDPFTCGAQFDSNFVSSNGNGLVFNGSTWEGISGCSVVTGSVSFQGISIGNPNRAGTTFTDAWTINHQKILKNLIPGIE